MQNKCSMGRRKKDKSLNDLLFERKPEREFSTYSDREILSDFRFKIKDINILPIRWLSVRRLLSFLSFLQISGCLHNVTLQLPKIGQLFLEGRCFLLKSVYGPSWRTTLFSRYIFKVQIYINIVLSRVNVCGKSSRPDGAEPLTRFEFDCRG